ncbi:ATP-dependent RNA helicase [Mycolicibacterium conceptionense]|uniref:ATP-dependent RNA helicase n=1 Tax=Mycolicibacterium conceptionense TaxID=451644 RepID=A0A0U1D1X3_9MYCO|nr:ATP-dependent RNA helicase [Mycolicibacterium conceptionense]
MSAQTSFADLGLPAPLVTALAANGVHSPFPIQAATLPDSLTGRDVLAAPHGSGRLTPSWWPASPRAAPAGHRTGRVR